MKTCLKCKVEKPLDHYNKRGQGKQPWCKVCNAERARRYYAENREKHLRVVYARTRRVIRETQMALCGYLRAHPCVDCGETDILVLEFDHLRDKEANVANLMRSGWKRVQREIEKCEVVCANCHRRRTAKRTPNYRCLGGVTERSKVPDF